MKNIKLNELTKITVMRNNNLALFHKEKCILKDTFSHVNRKGKKKKNHIRTSPFIY